MIRITESKYAYGETVARLQQKIADAGNRIFATIDQAAAAAGVGLTLRPTTLIVFGNPKAGTQLMESYPMIALELPLKLLVWEDGSAVRVAYVPATEIAARYQVSAEDTVIRAIDAALTALTATIA